jgi:hypothetical protein
MSLIRRQTTEAMAAANRANSQASTGPVTPAGKLQARMNAIEHGLRAEPAGVTAMRETLHVLPGDDLNRILHSEGFLDRQYERLLKQFEQFRERKNAIHMERQKRHAIPSHPPMREEASPQPIHHTNREIDRTKPSSY